jgi:hypothetical protein
MSKFTGFKYVCNRPNYKVEIDHYTHVTDWGQEPLYGKKDQHWISIDFLFSLDMLVWYKRFCLARVSLHVHVLYIASPNLG